MSNKDWNDYGAITGPLIVTLVLLILAHIEILDSKMWQTFKEIMEVVTAIAAAVIAYFAFRISKQQTEINEGQLRISRFEKRHSVFNGVMDLIAACLRQTVELRDLYDYRAATESAEFLFNKSIAEYVELLRLKAIEFIGVLEEFRKQNEENLRSGWPDRATDEQKKRTSEIGERRDKLFQFFEQQYDEAKKKFFNDLSIE